MNAIDFVLILILGWAAWKGFSRGLIIEIASLAALVLGTFAAVRFSWIMADVIQQYVDVEGNTLKLISFSLTFIVVVLLVMIVGKVLEKLVNLVMLGTINRIGGVLFSVAKLAVILSVLMMLLGIADSNKKIISQKLQDESALYQPIESMFPALLKLMRLPGIITNNLDEIREDKSEEKQVGEEQTV